MRNVPPDPDESVTQLVEHFFLVNHPDHYLTHQVCYYHYANILALAAYTKISYSYYYLWMLKPYAGPRTQTDKGKREKFL